MKNNNKMSKKCRTRDVIAPKFRETGKIYWYHLSDEQHPIIQQIIPCLSKMEIKTLKQNSKFVQTY